MSAVSSALVTVFVCMAVSQMSGGPIHRDIIGTLAQPPCGPLARVDPPSLPAPAQRVFAHLSRLSSVLAPRATLACASRLPSGPGAGVWHWEDGTRTLYLHASLLSDPGDGVRGMLDGLSAGLASSPSQIPSTRAALARAYDQEVFKLATQQM